MISHKDYNYTFNENACEKCGGKCCTGDSGYIYASSEELDNIAKFLNLNFEDFQKNYLIKVRFKFSLKEVRYKDGYRCIFFDTIHKKCLIYKYRPKQCKTFPFWEYFKTHKEELKKECVGVCFH
ncbi:Flagellin N-methylase [Campylobacter insulaenigrae]|uniref:YkgJ family cysteine cluster protein n=1 Tax=Campylobacter insulaenigrae TaxID=260714 RepID=UPI000F6D972B|nr:YkgJ family cysteine cluster protein [Campylobacter insulaenigrae]MCR6591362.1 YkgJ family cysteine cluster protein [Campylobacter insulaenigrae]MCR6592742.1 YkgJ family cysteine cluster protein [Campylobacter insulaenigrae]VEJ53963.1 Flagellin N-methylase [Campylobacter insulaenigrae]